MLAAVGIEGCVPGAKRRRGVVDGELDQRHEVGQSSARSPAKERSTSVIDTVDALDLAGRVLVVRRTEDERGTECGVQPGPEGAGESRVHLDSW